MYTEFSPPALGLHVKPTCVSCRLCEAIAPDVFAYTDAGISIRPGAEPLWPGLWAEIREAARLCPADAIRLGEVSHAA